MHLYFAGTLGSVWLHGENPKQVGEQKTLKARVRVGDRCNAFIIEWNVEVKKCSKDWNEYFVYYLTRVPGCPMRYCAGKFTTLSQMS